MPDETMVFYARKNPFSGEIQSVEGWHSSLEQMRSAATYNPEAFDDEDVIYKITVTPHKILKKSVTFVDWTPDG